MAAADDMRVVTGGSGRGVAPGPVQQAPGGGTGLPPPGEGEERSRWARVLGLLGPGHERHVSDAIAVLLEPTTGEVYVGAVIARALGRVLPRGLVLRCWTAADGKLSGPAGRYDFEPCDGLTFKDFMRRLAAEVAR